MGAVCWCGICFHWNIDGEMMNLIDEQTGMTYEATAYVIKFRGQYLKKIGWRGNVEWVVNISDARLYPSEEVIKKDLNKAAGECHDSGPFPVVDELRIKHIATIDHTERLLKNRERARKSQATKELRWNERETARERDNALMRLEVAQREYQRAQAAVESAKKQANTFTEFADGTNPMSMFGYGRGDDWRER